MAHTQQIRVRDARTAFSRWEIAAALFIVLLTAITLFPLLLPRARPMSYRSGASNIKMVSLALLSYIQDYDERLPPGVGFGYPVGPDGRERKERGVFARNWGPDRKLADGSIVPGLLQAYVYGGAKTFQDPDPRARKTLFSPFVPSVPTGPLRFMYNDLVTGESQAKMPGIAQTVVVCSAEDQEWNVGHAWLPDEGPYRAEFNSKGGCDPGQGATVRGAPKRISGGANYAFADGHAKWFKGVAENDPIQGGYRGIYFPPRSSDTRTANTKRTNPEPLPGGNMRGYTGTFQVR